MSICVLAVASAWMIVRWVRYFKKQQKVAGLTIDKLTAMKTDLINV